ncbi:MAG TPA: PIG-L deacetylase family protein [Chloroflexia bacterium]|jgi:LmbE family N-acetylglucosaminyl deacetylase
MADSDTRDNSDNKIINDEANTSQGQATAGTQSPAQLQSSATSVPTPPSLPPMNPIERPGPTAEEWPEEQRRVLLVAAHPDDPEFSSAGTVARWVRAGIEVIFVVATSGDKGTPDRSMTNERLSNLREDEQRAAAARLGVTTVEFLRFGDGELMPNMELRGAVTYMIRKYRPYAVMTHDPLTLFYNNEFINHPDHRAIGQATVDAIYPTARDPLQFPDHIREGLEPHKVKEIYLWGTEEPNILIDITETIEDKIEALKLHVTQVGEAVELGNRIKTRASQIGEPYGIAYAEAYRRVVMRM